MQNYSIKITPEAQSDLENIFDYIYQNSKEETIAFSFVEILSQYINNSLTFLPEKYPLYKKNIRKMTLNKNKKYSVFFSIDKNTLTVDILAITNTNQFTRYNNL